MWNDIDLYHAVRDFTSDPVTFPGEAVREFVKELVRDEMSSSCHGAESHCFRLITIKDVSRIVTSINVPNSRSCRHSDRRRRDTKTGQRHRHCA